MPSGSKKRKAAKKKKENQSNNHPDNPSPASTHSHGGDDVKTQDDKESDVEEVSSPASRDHHSHQNLSREGEEEEIEGVDNIANVPSAEGVKIEVVGDPNIVVEESVVPVEREFKIEDESNKKDVKHDETAKKSNEGASSGSSSSGSSSSSSDDESHDIKSSQAVADFAPVADSVKVGDSLSGGQAEAIHSAKIENADDPVMENIPAFVSEKIPLLGAEPQLDMSSSAGNSAAPSIVESVLKENGVKKLVSFEDEVGTSAVSEVAASQQKEEAIIPPVENNVTIPDQKECIGQETDDRLSLSYNAPIATADNGGDRENESGVIEPLLAPAPQRVQTSSWKSCCGLFEVFTRSGR